MNQVGIELCARLIVSPGNWRSFNNLGESREFYRALVNYLDSTGGMISVAERECPFSGHYSSKELREKADKLPYEKIPVAHWLGTNVTYFMNGEEGLGTTTLYCFVASVILEKEFAEILSVFDWQPPYFDDFACYDKDGQILAFANRHELEFSILQNSSIASLIDQ